jgi:hypothetical protein
VPLTAHDNPTAHKKLRAELAPLVLSGGVFCWRCKEPILPSQPWDLGHDDADRTRYRGPEHRWCNRATSGRERRPAVEVDLPERDGLDRLDERWRVPWLKGFRRLPTDATWPRLMTVPHPAAVDSLGGEFVRWSDGRTGGRLRWWQRLAAARMLEVDAQGRLVWDAVLLSMARQLGKSWLLRELCLWRIEQAERWGESQDVLHTGKDLAVCIEVQRSARIWARPQTDRYQVRETNGQEMIWYKPGLGGRWLLKAKGAPYGFSISAAVVDEAWQVDAVHIEDGVAPTMVERVSPQLLLVSTAHRLATSLMLTRRKVALENLESAEGDLLIEWSAPRGAPVDDLAAWRLASPHWSLQRERVLRRKLEAMYAGETHDLTEVDPAESFRAQWLNQWPKGLTLQVGEGLLPPGLWNRLRDSELENEAPLFVAVEDNYGQGAAVAAAARLEDGRIEVGGWLCPDWDHALNDVQRLGLVRRVRSVLVGASMLARVPPGMVPVPRPAGIAETRPGLAVFRDLAAGYRLAHDSTGELDDAVNAARVKEGVAGLIPVPNETTHLVKALVWAVQAAHRPAPMPGIAGPLSAVAA